MKIDNLSVYIYIPTYKRPEYLKACLEHMEKAQEYSSGVKFFIINDGSPDDGTKEILEGCKLNKVIINHEENQGLRNTTIDFLDIAVKERPDFICKVDNDFMVPKNWLNNLFEVFNTTDVDVLSPDYAPSHPAYTVATGDIENKGYRPSPTVGMWLMRTSILDDMVFDRTSLSGIRGSIYIMYQIVAEKEPNIGFTTKVVGNNYGHWSGNHKKTIKTKEYKDYYKEVGRAVSW